LVEVREYGLNSASSG